VTGLTAIQRETLLFIAKNIRERGYPPSIREMGRKFDMQSTNAISDKLSILERKGYITREVKAARGIALTEKGRAEVGDTSSPTKKIEVRPQDDGFVATLDGDRAQAFGKSSAAAIGRLVATFPEMFGVEIRAAKQEAA